MGLEGDQVGLENLIVDQSDTTVTFPNCPDVATEFFRPQRTSTKKPDKSIYKKVKEALDVYDGWYNSLTDTFDYELNLNDNKKTWLVTILAH